MPKLYKCIDISQEVPSLSLGYHLDICSGTASICKSLYASSQEQKMKIMLRNKINSEPP